MNNDKLRDYLNLESVHERQTFMQTAGKNSPDKKYERMMKACFEKINPVMREYIESKQPLFIECKTIEEISKLDIAPLPDHIKEIIIDIVDKPKDLNLVERTYLALDIFRAVSGQIGGNISRMAMHYAKALELLNDVGGRIIRPGGNKGGGRIITP